MKLEQFKEGDVIYRTKGVTGITEEVTDLSYNDPIMFLAIEKEILIYQFYDNGFLEDVYHTNMNRYNDDNWELFPVKLLNKLKGKYNKK